MDKAEELMNEKPDSALIILNGLDKTKGLNDSQNARYALLYSQALDKNYIDETNDSLINIAVEYYNENGTAKEKFLSLYYQGRIYYNAQNYAKSILAYTKAEQLIDEFEDDFIKGLLYTQLGFIYEKYYDYSKALNSYQLSYQYYDKANKYSHCRYAKYNEATIYAILPHDLNNTINTYYRIIKEAENANDTTLVSVCLSDLIVYLTQNEQFEKANSLLDSLISNYSIKNKTSDFFSATALLYVYNSNIKLSSEYMQIAKEKAEDNGDSVFIEINKAKIAALKKDYKSAYENLCDAKVLENKAVRKRLEHPIIAIQKDYLEKELEFNKYKQKSQMQTSIFIGLIIFLFGITIFIYLRNLIKKREYKISEYADFIEELQQKHQENKNIVSELLQNSFKEQYKVLNSIGDTIFNQTNDPKGQKIVYNEVKYIVERFKEKKTFQELEVLVNKYCDNVMEKLRTEVPTLEEEDYHQLCYHYAGFSGKLISLLLEKKQSNIYLRKSRLKEKIIQINPQNTDIILGYLA
ncbi:MAG: hypothetical protein IJE73_01940 [Muribaculaceae bacterium]|nr:hypothetical protein [Muribaculaceae bacterium]